MSSLQMGNNPCNHRWCLQHLKPFQTSELSAEEYVAPYLDLEECCAGLGRAGRRQEAHPGTTLLQVQVQGHIPVCGQVLRLVDPKALGVPALVARLQLKSRQRAALGVEWLEGGWSCTATRVCRLWGLSLTEQRLAGSLQGPAECVWTVRKAWVHHFWGGRAVVASLGRPGPTRRWLPWGGEPWALPP